MRVLYTEDSEFDADLTQRALARCGRDIELQIATTSCRTAPGWNCSPTCANRAGRSPSWC
jgi:hypothetical protein